MTRWDNIHWKICQHYKGPHSKNWYKHEPQKNLTILWDFSFYVDRKRQANKPDITKKDHKEKTCKLIDFTFPMDINIRTEKFEKLSKYKDLRTEIELMWQLKTSIIPTVADALGLVKKGTAKYLEKTPVK